MNTVRKQTISLIIASLVILTGCAETKLVIHSAKKIIGPSEETKKPTNPINYKIGKPYQIHGVWYYPAENYEYDETGIASWYGQKFHGGKTANGEIYNMNSLTAAHRTLPMPSYVRVNNLENGRSLVLRINDRGPFARGRVIDVSRRGAQLLGFKKQGTAKVRILILADRSREIKARINNQSELARIGTPITIDRMPKPSVQSYVLPSIKSSRNSLDEKEQSSRVKATANKIPLAQDISKVAIEPSGKVSKIPTIKTNIYVQIGAFTKFDNASRVRAKLAPIGQVRLSQILVNGRDFFRVRVGPLSNVSSADRTLAAVGKVGYRNAKIIVD